MSQDPEMLSRFYHLALREDWEEALRTGGPYSRSTLGKSLADEGFIHCSFAHQVQVIADAVYRGRKDVVLLTIDPSRLGQEVRIEAAADIEQRFPHTYGPLPLDAVVAADHLQQRSDGTLASEGVLGQARRLPPPCAVGSRLRADALIGQLQV